jgi:putative addiction module killer protein
MLSIRQTDVFQGWFSNLRDRNAQARIAQRLVRLQAGLFGDAKPVGEGVRELRVDYGPGYRVYFVQRGAELIVLLCGGDKRTQDRDIKLAKAIAKEITNEDNRL